MYLLRDKKTWFIVAGVLLIVMSFVFVFHSIIPHEHPHDLLPLGPFGILHHGMFEKYIAVTAVLFAFLVITPDRPSLDPGKRLAARRGTQSLAARSRLLYRMLFSKGIVHMNQR